MLNKDQSQQTSDGSTAIQAAGNVTIVQVGPSYDQVKEMALDIFRANFYEMAGEAKEIARSRAEEITEEFLAKLQKESPEDLRKADDPDFQYALYTVQREYARNGDKELGDLLVDLLCDRSKQDKRDILQIVLNESLQTAPKLTTEQLSVLSVIFLFAYTQNNTIGNHEIFGKYLDEHVKHFSDKLVKNIACYQHLEFTGCGTNGMGFRNLSTVLGNVYQGQFSKGFDQTAFDEKKISIGMDKFFFIACLNDASKTQVSANNLADLQKMFEMRALSEDDRNKITQLFHTNKMDDNEIQSKIIEIRPYMKEVFDVWQNSQMQSFSLTSVGIAIGHANIKRLVGEFADLSIWIN